jgi:AraC-like DNA-binding protein
MVSQRTIHGLSAHRGALTKPWGAYNFARARMARLLDTRKVAPSDIGDIVYDLFAHNTVPLEVAVDTTAPLVIDAALLGHASLLSTSSHDMWLRRTKRQTEEVVAFAIQRQGVAWFEYDDKADRFVTPGKLFMTDQSAPYRYHARGPNASCSIEMDYDDLGLPIDLVRKAADRLPASPLYDLVTNHLSALHRDLDQIEADPAASSVIGATTDLLRALVASASEVHRYSRPAMTEALLPMILAYVRLHLRERDLTPQRIARHHNISLRYLYKLCEGAEIRLMEWIIQQRLDGARQDLSRPARGQRTIAAIAYHWGFKDARHFSARFRRSYGLSPREWRAIHGRVNAQLTAPR